MVPPVPTPAGKHDAADEKPAKDANVSSAYGKLVVVYFPRTFCFLMAIDVAKPVDDGGVEIDLGPCKGRAALAAFVLGNGVLISVRTEAVFAVVINGVRPALQGTDQSGFNRHRCQKERHKEKSADTHDPTADFSLSHTVR